MASQTILLIEDEPDLVLGLRDSLEYEGYRVIVAGDGETAISRALQESPDLILLDLMLPKLSGLDVCRRLRRSRLETPIIMLTARSQETDKIIGLEIGADDYVTKPFSIQELLARIRVQLRRLTKQATEPDRYCFGEIELNLKKYQGFKCGQPLELLPREFELLKYFIQHRGETITREQLLNDIWGYNNFSITRTIDTHIARLRRKIERVPAEPEYLITVHRVGYKFVG